MPLTFVGGAAAASGLGRPARRMGAQAEQRGDERLGGVCDSVATGLEGEIRFGRCLVGGRMVLRPASVSAQSTASAMVDWPAPIDPSSTRWPATVPFAPSVSHAVAAAIRSGSTGDLRIASSSLQLVIASGSLGDDEAPLALVAACLLRAVSVSTLTPTGSAVPFRPENAARQVESQSAKLSAQQTSGAL